jgi:dipeptidyl aminopeptidase/acylaminoacyl peptidase
VSEQQVAPYGSWKSPIGVQALTKGTVALGQTALDSGYVYWSESRPEEGGRQVVVRRGPDGRTVDMVPAPYNARTKVHEYGGGAYVVNGGTLLFSNFDDQRLYRVDSVPGGEPMPPRPVTREEGLRYADAVIDHGRYRLVCVREDHRVEGREPVNEIAAVSVDGDDGGSVLVTGSDFYSNPRISPDGARMCWLSWNHPNMPWDGTELWVGEFDGDGGVSWMRRVAGGRGESIWQPEWSPDGVLHFVSDRTGWWNLYRWVNDEAQPLAPMEAEFGRPAWLFGGSTYAFESPGRIICAYNRRCSWHLASLDTHALRLEEIETLYDDISQVRASPGCALFTGGSPTEEYALVSLDLDSRETEVLRRSADLGIDREYLSVAQPVEFPTEGGRTAYGYYYAPRNRDYTAPEGERPPLIVMSHGGPTSAVTGTLDVETQFWTTRGFAVLDVNYGGSTGYGTEYRRRLNGQWGVVDVDDCVNGALYLVSQGLADPERLIIRGGSAGGYTTLCALAFRDVFHVGASYYGVSDVEALARDTHKFESRYLDSMIGPYPDAMELYRERSAAWYPEKLSCPVIFFQGLEDEVVPPAQSETMVEALKRRGVPVAYIAFEGEQHGFRKASSIERAAEAELYFYSRILGFELAEPVEPVQIYNLPAN